MDTDKSCKRKVVGKIIMDWIAAIVEITGAILVGNRQRAGFVVFILGNIVWIATAMRTTPRLWGLVFLCFVFVGINVRNYIKWRGIDRKEVI